LDIPVDKEKEFVDSVVLSPGWASMEVVFIFFRHFFALFRFSYFSEIVGITFSTTFTHI
jgi:hypothetical protein